MNQNSYYYLKCPNTGQSITYCHHPHHRNNNPNKSQWTINTNQEASCFKSSYTNNWYVNSNAWGLHYLGEGISYLGVGEDRNKKLFLAKFKKEPNKNFWHGYPADYQRNNQDLPDNDILNIWKSNNILTKAQISKIIQGKPCKL